MASPALARGQLLVPRIVFKPAAAANYTVAHRPDSAIRMIVIHVTESSAIGAVAWFENPRAQASANFVVSRAGGITEMVPISDIAWHAGNWAINRESIGIEHEGWTYRRGSFTDAEYRASAALVASELRHLLLPIDRKHIIGHYQVPDPNHPGLFGGFAHHTDPGPYWNWNLYMGYIRSYATGNAPAPQVVSAPTAPTPTAKPAITGHVGTSGTVDVSSSGLADGQTVGGFVRWEAKVDSGSVQQVDFLVDGKLRWTEHDAPYVYGGDGAGWDTTQESNGPHVLTLRVVTKGGKTVGQSIHVTVANTAFAVAFDGVQNGQSLKGTAGWSALPSGAGVDHVDFLVDGTVVHTEHTAPYTLDGWDTTKAANGPHTLGLRAVAKDGRVAETSLAVVVANPLPAAPKPVAAVSVVMTGLWDGRQVSGKVDWEAQTSGGTPDHVEFWIDGVKRWTERTAPYVFNGDGNTWDTSRESPGPHVVSVRAVAANGTVTDQQTFTVVVVPAAAPSVSSSLANGATVKGTVTWVATVTGPTPDRVDYYVDGRLVHTEYDAPYEYVWDTTGVRDGTHSLVVKDRAGSQTAQASATVTVANAAPAAAPPAPPAAPLSLASSVADGATVKGTVAWVATVGGPTPDRVDYYVDGRLLHTEYQAPFEFDWDTSGVADGSHSLLVKARAGSQTAQATATVTVSNGVAPLTVASSVADGATLKGTVAWVATVGGPTPDRVDYYVDGRLLHTEYQAPYEFDWDSTGVADGTHALLVKARAGSQTAQATATVTVANGVAKLTVASSIASGATLGGTVAWTASGEGPTPGRVDFYVDGHLLHTATAAPYELDWDTTTVADGTHTLLVKATAGQQTAQASATVTVSNGAAAPPPAQLAIVSQSIADGATLSGSVTWSVTTTGDVRRVDFVVDGHRAGSLWRAPWQGTLDTAQLGNGTHTLGVKVTGRDGTVVQAQVTVTVAN